MQLRDWAFAQLAELRAAERLRTLRVHTPADVIDFSSNDYLGLSSHPNLVDAAIETLRTSGVGARASRLVVGTHEVHQRAECELADFVDLPQSMLFSSGYAANVGVIPALVTRGDLILSDERNHASIIDGCRLSGANVQVFRHRDVRHLRQCLEKLRARFNHALVVSDTLFSMDGDLADVVGVRALCDEFKAWMMVDEAHALGVLGPQGRGWCAAQRVVPDLLMGGLGKAFGCSGGFVAATDEVIHWLANRARSFVFSTAVPMAQAAAIRAAIPLVRDAKHERLQIAQHQHYLRDALGHTCAPHDADATPIVPVGTNDERRTLKISEALRKQGFLCAPIRPPTVPIGASRLRIVTTSKHQRSDIVRLANALHVVLE